MWKELLPSRNHMPYPRALLHAMVTLSLLWGWPSVTALFIIGFIGMLRRTELASLRRDHLVFAEEFVQPGWWLFIKIESPKMRRKGA